jgi:hypothetical protein
MKKIYLLLLLPLAMVACQQKPAAPAATTSVTPTYPYKIEHPDYWLMDTSHTNTVAALKAVKAFETKDSTAMKSLLGDSIEFNYNGGQYKGPSKGFIKMSVEMATMTKDLKIDMKDWESVVSTDGKEEWVTLWYIQKWTDAKGKPDSVRLVNDLQFKKGKIVKLDEYDMEHEKAKK